MDAVVKIVKSLGGIDLGRLLGVGVFFIFLVLLILKGSILQTGLRIFTKKKFGFYFMVIPTFLAILLNMILLFIAYIVVTKININIVEVGIQYLFNSLTDFKPLLHIILVLIIAEVVFLVIQPFILKLVTFDIYNSIKKLFKSITKKSKGTENNVQIDAELNATTQEIEIANTRPSYVNGLLAGLFCFSIMVFLTIILLYVGELIGSKLNL